MVKQNKKDYQTPAFEMCALCQGSCLCASADIGSDAGSPEDFNLEDFNW